MFDLEHDPHELHDLAHDAAYASVREELIDLLISQLYGEDLNWIEGGQLKGLPDQPYEPRPNRGLTAQRGWRFV